MIGFKRVDVCHPPGKMWLEVATRRCASFLCSDRAVQTEGWITHEPVALFGLLWNTRLWCACHRAIESGMRAFRSSSVAP